MMSPPNVAPALSLAAVVDRPRVDPGEEITVDLFISGVGTITTHHLVVHVPEQIMQGDVAATTFPFVSNPAWRYAKPGCPPQRHVGNHRFVISFNRHYFEVGPSGLLNAEDLIVCEGEGHAPASISFRIAADAPTGDHEVSLRLVYAGPNGGGVAEANPKLAIRSFAERHQNFIMTLIAVVTFAAPIVVGLLAEPFRVGASVSVAAVLLALLLSLRQR